MIQKFHARACITWLKAFSQKVRAVEQRACPTPRAKINSGLPYQADVFWLPVQGIWKSELPLLMFLTSDKYFPYREHTQWDSWHAKEDTSVREVDLVYFPLYFSASTKDVGCMSYSTGTEPAQCTGGHEHASVSCRELQSPHHISGSCRKSPRMVRAESRFLPLRGISLFLWNKSLLPPTLPEIKKKTFIQCALE